MVLCSGGKGKSVLLGGCDGVDAGAFAVIWVDEAVVARRRRRVYRPIGMLLVLEGLCVE